MAPPRKSPGPAADRAFTIGVLVATVGALAAVGFLYWTGVLTPLLVGFTLVVLLPVYLLVVASALSKWLGYDRGVSDLRRVSREDESRSRRGPGPR
ncbi:MAG: hypothetical protein V5A61_03915 [Haloarculaceae archaeon]